MPSYLERLKSIKISQNDKILILGLGVENRQFLHWLINELEFNPQKIVLADKKAITLDFAEVENFECFFGENYLESLQHPEVIMVIKAPGIWSLQPEFNEFRIHHGQDSVLSSLTFFLEKYRGQIIGVTGTKGKTTTSNLIHHLLKDDFETYYCGNTTGVSPYKYWGNQDAIFVIELSSFQLQDLAYAKISPRFALITNYYVDHLDQHANAREYWKAKDVIFEFQKSDNYLVAHDNLWTNIREREIDSKTDPDLLKYNTENPNDQFMVSPILVSGFEQNFSTNLIGKHNVENLSLALILVQIVKLTRTINQNKTNLVLNLAVALKELFIQKEHYQVLLNQFQPVKGRLELVKTIQKQDIKFNFYNDNTANEPDAVRVAIEALTQNPAQGLYLICGGKLKQGNFEDLVKLIRQKIDSRQIIKYTFCSEVGLELDKLDKIAGNLGFKVQSKVKELFAEGLDLDDLTTNLDPKFKTINILFSPGGSSFNEFENYIERQKFLLEWFENAKTN